MAITGTKPQALLANEDRKKFSTPEEYYNNKYPKRNVTFPKIERDKKSATSSKAFILYNVDVRTILNSKSFRLPRTTIYDPQKKRSRLSSIIASIERRTMYDLNFDGEIGIESDSIKRQNAIALESLRWVVKNIRYTQLNDSGEDTNTGFWSAHRLINILNEDVTAVEASVLNGENWSFSYQTLGRKNGDCEDGTILLYDILRNSGIPAWKLRVNAGFVKGGVGHCWLSYYVESQFWQSRRDDKWVNLDWCYLPDKDTNVKDRLRRGDDKSYDPVVDFSFNEDFTWSFGIMRFAPLYHTETCNIFHPDYKSKESGYFDWESKFCTCGPSIQAI